MLQELFFIFWFFLPAGNAIVAPLYAAKISFLKKFSYPIDCYKTFRKKRLFGSHKTIRGFVVGTLAAIVTVFLEVFLYQHVLFFRQIIFLDYAKIDPLLFGFLLGFGALTGDAIKSFFKRQIGIKPGKSWFPFDQTDHIIGGILFTWFYITLTLKEYLLLLIFWFFVHLLTSFIGYLIKLKRQPL